MTTEPKPKPVYLDNIHEECGGVKSGTGVVLCNCARAKEGEKR